MRLFRFACLALLGSYSFNVFAQASGTPASGTVGGFDLANEAIIRNLDSLVSLRFFKKEGLTSPVPNKYGYPLGFAPPLVDSVISRRMMQIQSPIPLRHNAHVRGFIDLYGIRRKTNTERVMSLSKYYYPIFEAALERHRLPHQLKHLAVVESALNPTAVSRVGATGLWQFMYGTGAQYGLKVNYYLDERMDPVLSSDAACRFLRDLHHTYNDWLLALAAYNCGPGNVNRAIRRSGGKTTFWEIMPYLPAETRGYVPAFIAVTYLMSYPAEHNLQQFPLIALPAETDTVGVQGPLPISYFAQLLGLEADVLSLLNPQLKQKFVPSGYPEYALRIPAKLVPEFERKRASYLNHVFDLSQSRVLAEQAVAANAALADPGSSKVPRKEWVYHKVRRGEKLYSIAVKYGTTIKELKQINGLRSNNVRVGTLIKIRKNPAPTPTNAASKDSAVVISTKENPPKAGVVLDTTTNQDLAVSKAKTSAVGKGSEVNSSVASKSSVTFYKVRRGDSLYGISKKFENLTVEDLMRLNNLTIRSQLRPGMTLRVKAK